MILPGGTMPAKGADRKLAAILAADAVGFSRLIGADEEGTLDRLNSIRRELSIPPSRPAMAEYSRTPETGFWLCTPILIRWRPAADGDGVRPALRIEGSARSKGDEFLCPSTRGWRRGGEPLPAGAVHRSRSAVTDARSSA